MGERNAPLVFVTVLGKDNPEERLDLSERVRSFTFSESAGKKDQCTITLDNFDLALFDDVKFQKGNSYKVQWGYADQMSAPRRVTVKSVKGFNELEVEAFDDTVFFDRHNECRSFKNKKISDIVKTLGQEQGFTGPLLNVEDTESVHSTINIAGETVHRWLTRHAKKEGFDYYVDDTGLHFHKRRHDKKPSRKIVFYQSLSLGGSGEFALNGDIIGFPTAESDFLRTVGSVKENGIDKDTKAEIKGEGSDKENADPVAGNAVEDVGRDFNAIFGLKPVQKTNNQTSTRASSKTSEAKIKKSAKARYRIQSQERCKMRMTLVGDPSLRSKQMVEMSGVGQYWGGNYFVKEAIHSLAPGSEYSTEVLLTRQGGNKVDGKVDEASKKTNEKKAEEDKPQSEKGRFVDGERDENGFTRRGSFVVFENDAPKDSKNKSKALPELT